VSTKVLLSARFCFHAIHGCKGAPLVVVLDKPRAPLSRKVVCTQPLSQSVSQSVSLRPTTKHQTHNILFHTPATWNSLSRRNVKVFYALPFFHPQTRETHIWKFPICSGSRQLYFTRVGVTFCSFTKPNFLRQLDSCCVELTRALLLSPVKNQPPSLVIILYILLSGETSFGDFLYVGRANYTRGAAGETLFCSGFRERSSWRDILVLESFENFKCFLWLQIGQAWTTDFIIIIIIYK
jgi:hypothetical protein